MKFAIAILMIGFSQQSFAALDCSEATMKARQMHIDQMDLHITKLNAVAKQTEEAHQNAKPANVADDSISTMALRLVSKADDLEKLKSKLIIANLRCDVKILKEIKK